MMALLHKPKHVAVKLHDIQELWLTYPIYISVCLYRSRMFHLETNIFALETDWNYCSEDTAIDAGLTSVGHAVLREVWATNQLTKLLSIYVGESEIAERFI